MYNSHRTNIVQRIFDRQITTPKPNTNVNCCRRLYENIIPDHTIYDIDSPDHLFRKFTDDGQYLISYSRNHQDLIVYRPTWPSFSTSEYPNKAKRFDTFFTPLYSVTLATNNEFICKDFFLYFHKHHYGLFATQTPQLYNNNNNNVAAVVQGIPSIEKMTFYLIRMEDGVTLDEKVFDNDFVNLAHSMGAFFYDDLLAIVSLRYQKIHVIQVRDSGNLVDVQAIGPFCREDDELFISSHAQYMGNSDRYKQTELPLSQSGNEVQQHPVEAQSSLLSGIKQRLLAFMFRGIWNEERDHSLRVQSLKKKFYFHFQDFADLIMWKVQFLDRHHLLIKFGSIDGGVSRNVDNQPSFLAVYSMESSEIIAFYQHSADELYHLFEQFCDHFHAPSKNTIFMNFIPSHSNNIHALEQLRSIKSKASSYSQFVKKMLASLPFSCQTQSPSPYFDPSLFRFDEKLISATDRHRQSTEHPIKFISRRHPNIFKFKIKPGPENGGADGQAKKISSFLFHPIFPLALSIQHTLRQPTVVNVHFRSS